MKDFLEMLWSEDYSDAVIMGVAALLFLVTSPIMLPFALLGKLIKKIMERQEDG